MASGVNVMEGTMSEAGNDLTSLQTGCNVYKSSRFSTTRCLRANQSPGYNHKVCSAEAGMVVVATVRAAAVAASAIWRLECKLSMVSWSLDLRRTFCAGNYWNADPLQRGIGFETKLVW